MNIHQATAHFCRLDSTVKGVCVCVCVCVCVYVWLNRTVSVSALLRIQDAYSRILNPAGLGVGSPPCRWLLRQDQLGASDGPRSAPPFLFQLPR